MSHANFVHLRVHSAYSLSEGAIRIKDLGDMCRDGKMPAVAVTDTNNMFGALEFSLSVVEKGVQPIIGCQLSVAREREETSPSCRVQHVPPDQVVALVQNDHGYRNLLKLLSIAYMDSEDAEEPKVTLANLEAHADGLILLSGATQGPVGRLLLAGQDTAAERTLERLLGAFGDRFSVELQRHGLES